MEFVNRKNDLVNKLSLKYRKLANVELFLSRI